MRLSALAPVAPLLLRCGAPAMRDRLVLTGDCAVCLGYGAIQGAVDAALPAGPLGLRLADARWRGAPVAVVDGAYASSTRRAPPRRSRRCRGHRRAGQ